MLLAAFDRPRPVTCHRGRFANADRGVLMPTQRPVGFSGLVEQDRTHGAALRADDRRGEGPDLHVRRQKWLKGRNSASEFRQRAAAGRRRVRVQFADDAGDHPCVQLGSVALEVETGLLPSPSVHQIAAREQLVLQRRRIDEPVPGDPDRSGARDIRRHIVDEQRARRVDAESLDREAVDRGSGFISFSVPDPTISRKRSNTGWVGAKPSQNSLGRNWRSRRAARPRRRGARRVRGCPASGRGSSR